MGALFAGAARAPITSIIIVPEMFDNSHLLPPLMISATTSYIVSSLLMKGSIYTLKLRRRGINIEHSHDRLQTVLVKEVMTPVEKVVKAESDAPVTLVADYLWKWGHAGYPVMEKGKLVGIITLSDIKKVKPENRDKTRVGEVASKNLTVAYPEDTVLEALEKMVEKNVGRLPVVKRNTPTELVGIITKKDVIQAERKARRTAEMDL